MAKHKTLQELFSAIATSLRRKTGGSAKISADDFPTVIDGLDTSGITPTGTKSITTNGTHDVTAYASAQVNVQTGITPSGTKTITENGTYDVTSFASALVSVEGLKAKAYTVTLSADVTTTSAYTVRAADSYIAGIRSNANGFVLMIYLGAAASTAMSTMWVCTNKNITYSGSTVYRAVLVRQSTSSTSTKFGPNAMTGENWNGLLNVASDGRLYINPDANYPMKKGDYLIIAGTMESL